MVVSGEPMLIINILHMKFIFQDPHILLMDDTADL